MTLFVDAYQSKVFWQSFEISVYIVLWLVPLTLWFSGNYLWKYGIILKCCVWILSIIFPFSATQISIDILPFVFAILKRYFVFALENICVSNPIWNNVLFYIVFVSLPLPLRPIVLLKPFGDNICIESIWFENKNVKGRISRPEHFKLSGKDRQ